MSSRVITTLCLFVCMFGLVILHPHLGFKIDRLDHLVITVQNVTRTIDFYTKVLNLEPRGPTLHFGDSKINVHQLGREWLPKSRVPTPGSADLCFITDTSLDEVIQHVEKNNVSIIEGPVWRPGALGSIMSAYFRDPDGNLIEVANYL